MQQLIRRDHFEFTVNKAFRDVIATAGHFAQGSGGHLDHRRMKLAYIRLHGEGYAHSGGTWLNGELVGGTLRHPAGESVLRGKHVQ